jgi:hypothetical protein
VGITESDSREIECDVVRCDAQCTMPGRRRAYTHTTSYHTLKLMITPEPCPGRFLHVHNNPLLPCSPSVILPPMYQWRSKSLAATSLLLPLSLPLSLPQWPTTIPEARGINDEWQIDWHESPRKPRCSLGSPCCPFSSPLLPLSPFSLSPSS